MLHVDRILCRIGLHKWSPWDITETTLDIPNTGHEILDSIEDTLSIETRTRECECCPKGEIKQRLCW